MRARARLRGTRHRRRHGPGSPPSSRRHRRSQTMEVDADRELGVGVAGFLRREDRPQIARSREPEQPGAVIQRGGELGRRHADVLLEPEDEPGGHGATSASAAARGRPGRPGHAAPRHRSEPARRTRSPRRRSDGRPRRSARPAGSRPRGLSRRPGRETVRSLDENSRSSSTARPRFAPDHAMPDRDRSRFAAHESGRSGCIAAWGRFAAPRSSSTWTVC